MKHAHRDLGILPNDGLYDSSYNILELARKSIKACPNLHEISLVLHDHELTPLFMMFLSSLWASDSIGPCLRTLSIDTTVAKLPTLLNPIIKRAVSLPNLSAFNINISLSRFEHNLHDWKAAIDVLAKFLRTFTTSITSFTFSSLIDTNIDNVFAALPRLEKLETFALLSVFNSHCFPTTKYIHGFILRHADTLKMLNLKPRGRSVSLNAPDKSYGDWIRGAGNNGGDITIPDKRPSFATLFLPNLHALDIGLHRTWNQEPDDISFLLPSLTDICPNLTTLILTDFTLVPRSVLTLFQMLAASEGRRSVESITFTSLLLFPELFDSIARYLPNLKSLEINYSYFGKAVSDNSGYHEGKRQVGITFRLTAAAKIFFQDLFVTAMQARRYPMLNLRYLRLAGTYSCGTAHPCLGIMQLISQALGKDIFLDTGLRCQCKEGINYYPSLFLPPNHRYPRDY